MKVELLIKVSKTNMYSLQVQSPPAVPHRFEEEATYVLSGGFGGLGRSIARWMVSRGAKNLAILSRSGAKNQSAIRLVEELEAKGCRVVSPVCDVSNRDAVLKALESCKSLPPIKGCIQGAMHLKVGFPALIAHQSPKQLTKLL